MWSYSAWSLRNRILVPVLVLVLLVAVSALGIVQFMARDWRTDTQYTLKNTAQRLSGGIQARFFERYGDVQSFGLNNAVKEALLDSSPKNARAVASFFNDLVALYKIYPLVSLVDLNGRVLAVNTKDKSGRDIPSEKLLGRSLADSAWFKAVSSGQFVEDSKKGLVGTYTEDFAWDALVREVYGIESLTQVFAAPVKDASGKVIGFVCNRASSSYLAYDMVDTYEEKQSAGWSALELMLIGKNGLVQLEFDPSGTGRLDYFDNPNSSLKLNVVASKIEPAIRALKGEAGVMRAYHPGKKVDRYAGFTPVQGSKIVDSLGWAVVARVSIENIEAKQAHFVLWSTFAMILAVALIGFVVVLVVRKISGSLELLAGRIKEVSTTVVASSNQLSQAGQSLSETSTEQSAAVEDTAASMDEMTAMIGQTSSNAVSALERARGSQVDADEGLQVVADLKRAMDEISTSNRELQAISEVIKQIERKTKVINDIVFETRLLSFNASIEAARAGHHGRGFAVVAEEVGNLAKMSGKAAEEIRELIDQSTTKVGHVVESTGNKVQMGLQISESASASFKKIADNVASLVPMVNAITTASKEQEAGVSQTGKAMQQLDVVASRNSKTADEAVQVSTNLIRQAEALQGSVVDLERILRGSDAALAAPTRYTAHSPFVSPARPEPSPKLNGNKKKKIPLPSADDPRFKD
jgi:methyl-accepting chemotaxis protein